jgi:hypothetical protein
MEGAAKAKAKQTAKKMANQRVSSFLDRLLFTLGTPFMYLYF